MKSLRELRVLAALLRGQGREGTAAERLDRFYQHQASHYDAFRERLLHGRDDLIKRLPASGRLVELGGGTGRNLLAWGSRLEQFDQVTLVDLCRPLLAEAQQRWQHHPKIQLVHADATTWQPEQPVDCVYFSYALTMIPDWYLAIDNALAMLRPGGVLAVVDFYVSRRVAAPRRVQHGWLTRHFWPAWFGHDGVVPSPDHLPYLQSRLQIDWLKEAAAPIPYLPGLRMPYYALIGRKPLR